MPLHLLQANHSTNFRFHPQDLKNRKKENRTTRQWANYLGGGGEEWIIWGKVDSVHPIPTSYGHKVSPPWPLP